jgi:heat-inducible transcriptional repressor
MLDERKTAILRAVIREYIETAQPVGSAHVARSQTLSISSATIRNEMAVLEQEGFLTQPHTSAGRIPTDKGYRFFVDHLAQPSRLDGPTTQQVHEFFRSSHGALEGLLADTSRMLARLTNYTAVVVRPPAETATVRSAQIVGLSARTALIVVVLSDGTVENVNLDLGDDVSEGRVNAASAHLAANVIGRHLGDNREFTATGDTIVDDLTVSAWAEVGRRGDDDTDQAYVGGASRVAQAFDAVDTVRSVLGALEHQYLVVSLLRDVTERGLSVAIGAEHGVEPLAACWVRRA